MTAEAASAEQPPVNPAADVPGASSRPKRANGRAAKAERGHTPVMQQYFRAKSQYPDCIIFFRLGDFYEMFFDDAKRAAALIDLTLTSRGTDPDGNRIPMAGVPHHAASSYIARLLEHGQSIAICEQLDDPTTVRGIVRRDVVRVITPGLVLEPDSLPARAHNYLVALTRGADGLALAALEYSTAALSICPALDEVGVLNELARLGPTEILFTEEDYSQLESLRSAISALLPRAVTQRVPLQGAEFDIAERCPVPEGLSPTAMRALSVALNYATRTVAGQSFRLNRVEVYAPSSYLYLDATTVRNLEIVRTLSGDAGDTLLSCLDETHTAMGARTLREWLLAPLCDPAAIDARLTQVDAFTRDHTLRRTVRDHLAGVPDLERYATRLALDLSTPRELVALRSGLHAARSALAVANLRDRRSPQAWAPLLALLDAALAAEPPVEAGEGGVFCVGYNGDLDQLWQRSESGRDAILALEQRERERTGITSLKVRYTRVFGYYIEVTRSNLRSVPADYRRKQTIAGGERFSSPELDALQDDVLHAQERARALEIELFAALRRTAATYVGALYELARAIALIDVYSALAEVAVVHDYVRPTVDASRSIRLEGSRHPVVERTLGSASRFVPNTVELDEGSHRMLLITGPNMAGKSTVMRQVALTVIMAQMGSFVPARAAHIGVVDRVFTRIGASDNLALGQSTFMVEMAETATILRESSTRSLVVLDEVGRGTSTHDGLAIAWAVMEHLHHQIQCRALFATHYHELCEPAEAMPGIALCTVSARESSEGVVFLYQLQAGRASRSYGIAVAEHAGLPQTTIARAKALLETFEVAKGAGASAIPLAGRQPARHVARLQPEAELLDLQRALVQLDPERLTPLEALVELAKLRKLVNTPAAS